LDQLPAESMVDFNKFIKDEKLSTEYMSAEPPLVIHKSLSFD